MSNQKESLTLGILKYSISTWINLIVGLLSVVVTTRLINPHDYGLITIFISSTAFLMYILTLGLDSAFIRFYNDPPKGNTQNQLLYKCLFISTVFCCIAGLLVFFSFSSKVSFFIFGIESKLLICLMFIYCLSQVWLRYLNISFRMSFRAKQYNIQNILINCLTRILIILSALISNNYLFIISILTIGIASTLIIYLFVQKNEFTPINSQGQLDRSLDFSGFRPYFRFALFSAPTYIVVYFNTFMSQQIIREEIDAHALGIFASVSMFISILTAVQGGFSTYWSAYVYKNYSEEDSKIKKMHDVIVAFAIIMASAVVCSRDFIYLFIGSFYHSSKTFFSLILILPILNFIRETTDKGLQISNNNHISLFIHILTVMINLGLSYCLINKIGIIGAAIANAISGVFLFTTSAYYGQKYFRTINSIIKSSCGVFVLLCLLTLPSITNNIMNIIFGTLLLDVIAFSIYKDEVGLMCNVVLSFLVKKKYNL
jgi:hypothetical protein